MINLFIEINKMEEVRAEKPFEDELGVVPNEKEDDGCDIGKGPSNSR